MLDFRLRDFSNCIGVWYHLSSHAAIQSPSMGLTAKSFDFSLLVFATVFFALAYFLSQIYIGPLAHSCADLSLCKFSLTNFRSYVMIISIFPYSVSLFCFVTAILILVLVGRIRMELGVRKAGTQ